MNLKWNPRSLVSEPIKQANTLAIIALGVAIIALGMAFKNGMSHAH